MSKSSTKLAAIIGYRVKVTLNDSRTLVGHILAFDKHLNLVLNQCEEFRLAKASNKKKGGANDADDDEEEEEMKRMLGLVILRGETVVTLSVEGPPPVEDDTKGPQMGAGPGHGAPAGRGMGLSSMPTMRMAPQMNPPSFAPPGMMMPPPGMMPPGFMPPPPGFGGR